jgi:U6 snRNA-associated Sm-like protein LSm6
MADGNPLPVPTGAAKTPSDFLKSIKGKPVLVKLNSGVDYRGESANVHG